MVVAVDSSSNSHSSSSNNNRGEIVVLVEEEAIEVEAHLIVVRGRAVVDLDQAVLQIIHPAHQEEEELLLLGLQLEGEAAKGEEEIVAPHVMHLNDVNVVVVHHLHTRFVSNNKSV